MSVQHKPLSPQALSPPPLQSMDAAAVLRTIEQQARALGFAAIGVADVDLCSAEAGLLRWLEQGFHGSMDYMAAHGRKRARPAELVPGTVRVITVRMDYLPAATLPDWRMRELARQQQPHEAIISVYARGRDYHKVLRSRLQKLAQAIADLVGGMGYRVFTDSAPVMEVELASRSGLGWRGKHTLLLNRAAGSMFFLGEIFVDIPLPLTPPVDGHCGQCSACIQACPTQAIVAPHWLDARRCISYLTIEYAGSIDPALRPLMGNHIYGCDDCQLVCPWNKFAQRHALPDFDERHQLGQAQLLSLWQWSEADFLHRTEGSPIRRIGYERWQRNIAIALGNALRQPDLPATTRTAMQAALQARMDGASALLQEHIHWALQQLPAVQNAAPAL